MSPSAGKTDMDHQEYSPSERARCKTKDLPNHHSHPFYSIQIHQTCSAQEALQKYKGADGHRLTKECKENN